MDDFLALAGSVTITVGLWMAWPPLGVVAGGAQLMVLGLILGHRKANMARLNAPPGETE